ncbi:ribosomal-processing cysteine protease Prp [Fusibacter ferrireducens]|uniref:Ribosomal processing cysteine protease Prp n=1 Tax=Fusibacter ferrireducens TaxID=2785058 RepID=A0ABR9ZWP8_9FIRM|nr:ribosomal-processing cysteine protease Prp [Fusibacter ferrireducens]MBF4694877.1 ribosomal-processing cysteine protease Prp [Fusibacter ferrireducens]
MIRVDVTKTSDHYYKLKLSGHAYSDEPGRDLVCGAVSTLAQTVANALEQIGEVPEASLDLKIKNGHLSLSIEQAYRSETTNIIFATFIVGIEGIEGTYPEYVRLRIEEV